ncbi:LCP family protein [Streptomyces netropsis]|uniref:LCP family protein required for cell wall assembly n=1 Tax=Streptomyces netropsis TaxID=55404 RepID=A0A7W7LCJ9_STRNE|nr:LCP family protein [Streptomyces netropsis]MBB4887131.1 LCP family protein required for cell wall assembly [Streptomyces netropsis]GGR25541.1 transcriptional regulator [Streptomyces netropsis]
MTDRPGSPGSPGTPAGPTGGAWGAPTPSPEPRRRRRWLRWAALGVTVLVLTAAGIGWALYQRLDSNITTDTDTANELARWEKERPVALVHGAQNILIIGSDTRGAGNGAYGTDSGTQRSDTTILLHLAADRRSATAVSLPRDLMSTIPSCRQPDGSRTNERFAQFNWAYELAGAACTIRTVENITRIRVDHHVIVDFNGFKRLVDAIDGVEVCLKQPVDDHEAKLRLPAGRQVLRGEAALGYVRARYSLGNGSDTERMGRQQEFLGSLFREMQSSGVLLNPARLYPVLDAATSSLTTDAGLDTLRKLYDLVRTVRDIPSEQVQFLTVPRRPYVYNSARDELVQPDADQLFEQLRNDRRVAVGRHVRAADNKPGRDEQPASPAAPGSAGETGATEGRTASEAPAAPADPGPSAAPTGSLKPTTPPTYEGTTAARGMCG